MTATTATTLRCPTWCLGQHLEDEHGQLEGTVHQRRVVVGDVYVTIEESTDVPEGCPDPVGPTVEVDQYQWVSGESVRWLADALNQAADLIGIEVGSR